MYCTDYMHACMNENNKGIITRTSIICITKSQATYYVRPYYAIAVKQQCCLLQDALDAPLAVCKEVKPES